MRRTLYEHLRDHNFWVRSSDAPALVKKLELDIDGFEVDYIRDVRVWIPFEQYGYQVPCPGCERWEHVGMHGFRDADDYVARRITSLGIDFYIMSCRLICHACKEVAVNAKADAREKAEAAGFRCEDVEPEPEDEEDLERLSSKYTFMSYNKISLWLLPFSLGMRCMGVQAVLVTVDVNVW